MIEKQELLQKLRNAKDAKALSYQDIADITEENGEAVSLSTIKRIFQKDSDLEDFRYHQTVRPIIRAVLGLDEPTAEPFAQPSTEQAEQYYATIEGLKAVVELKHEQILALQRENSRLTSELADFKVDRKEELKKQTEDSQKKIDYLKEVAETRQKNIEWYKDSLRWHRVAMLVLGIIVALAIAALVLDLSLGNYGWIRY